MGHLTPCLSKGRAFVHNDCPGEGFLLPSSRVPGGCPGEGWLWMKLIPALTNESDKFMENNENTAKILLDVK